MKNDALMSSNEYFIIVYCYCVEKERYICTNSLILSHKAKANTERLNYATFCHISGQVCIHLSFTWTIMHSIDMCINKDFVAIANGKAYVKLPWMFVIPIYTKEWKHQFTFSFFCYHGLNNWHVCGPDIRLHSCV